MTSDLEGRLKLNVVWVEFEQVYPKESEFYEPAFLLLYSTEVRDSFAWVVSILKSIFTPLGSKLIRCNKSNAYLVFRYKFDERSHVTIRGE